VNVEDECYQNGECQFPLSALKKIGNPRLSSTFPEIADFLFKYKMNTNDVNYILAEHHHLQSTSTSMELSASELWEAAACSWLRTSGGDGVDDLWTTEITRFRCDDEEGTVALSEEDCPPSPTLSATKLTMYILGAVAAIIAALFIAYNVVVMCYDAEILTPCHRRGESKRPSTIASGLEVEPRRKREKERRRLCYSMLTDIASITLGVVDFTSDILAYWSILTVFDTANNAYSPGFVILYFVLTVITSFVSAIYIVIISQNVLKAASEYKHGVREDVGAEGDVRIDPHLLTTFNLDVVDEEETSKLLFKYRLIQRKLRNQSISIFVGFFEDLPFIALNAYGMLIHSHSTCGLNKFLLLSTLVNCISLGYKTSIIEEFFKHLQQRRNVKESIDNLSGASRRARQSKSPSAKKSNKGGGSLVVRKRHNTFNRSPTGVSSNRNGLGRNRIVPEMSPSGTPDDSPQKKLSVSTGNKLECDI